MASSECTVVSETRCFQGSVIKYEHRSETLNCTMRFNAYLPDTRCTLPVLYFLSGLTCTEDNFMQKAGALRYLSDRRIILICPDTSPRGVDVEGQDAADDLGTGAGFYVDATEPQWKDHYRMYSYVTEELPALVGRHLPVDKTRVSIMGHSMGGHGALVCALRNPNKYRSVSGFAAICNPSECSWGQKAFTAYMGDHRKAWADYDATALVKRYTGPALPILLDQGDQDPFLKKGQLLPERFIRAVEDNPEKQNLHLDNHMRPGFDHSYYFIQTFIEEHIQFHARHLLA